MKVIYRGLMGIPAVLDGKQPGDEMELSDDQIAALRRHGHEFEPADHRRSLPDAAPAPVVAPPDEEGDAHAADARAKAKK